MKQTESEILDRDAGLDLSILLRDLPGIALRRKDYIICALVASLTLGVAYLLVATPIYHVGARILVQLRDLPLQEQDRSTRRGTFLRTQAEIINSPAVIRGALEVVPFADFEGTERDRLELALKSFGVTPVDGADVLTLSFRSSNLDEAIQFVAATIVSYRQFVRETGNTELEALQILARREKELREALMVTEERYREFRAQSELVGSEDQVFSASKAMLTRLGDQLVEAKARRLDLESQLEAALAGERKAARPGDTIEITVEGRRSNETSGATGLAGDGEPGESMAGLSADAEKIEEELWLAKVRLAGLLQSFGDAHPHVREARQQAAMWEARHTESLAAKRGEIERELRVAKEAVWRLDGLYRGEFAKTKTIDSQQLEVQQLEENLKRDREIHQAILSKLQDWELSHEAVTQSQGGIDVRTLEGPGLREAKVWPNPVLVLGPCGFIGLVGGLLVAIIIDRVGRRPLPRPARIADSQPPQKEDGSQTPDGRTRSSGTESRDTDPGGPHIQWGMKRPLRKFQGPVEPGK